MLYVIMLGVCYTECRGAPSCFCLVPKKKILETYNEGAAILFLMTKMNLSFFEQLIFKFSWPWSILETCHIFEYIGNAPYFQNEDLQL
jgi:hypothetical protein